MWKKNVTKQTFFYCRIPKFSDARKFCFNHPRIQTKRSLEPCCEKTGLQGIQAVQPQKMARGLKFCI